MEAVTTNAVFFKVFVWDCVQVGFFIHAHTEGGVKYSNVWFAWAYFLQASIPIRLAGLCRGPRSKHSRIAALTSSLTTMDFCEFCAAVEYAVTNCVDFLNGSDNTVVFVGQGIQNQFYSYGMVWHWGFNNIVVFTWNFVGQNGTLRCRFSHTDLLSERARSPYQSADISERSFRSSLQEFFISNSSIVFKASRKRVERQIDTFLYTYYIIISESTFQEKKSDFEESGQYFLKTRKIGQTSPEIARI